MIVPVVLYHGAAPWSAPVAFDALLDIPEAVRPAVAPHLLQFRYLVDDLSEVPDDQLRARAMTALGQLVMVCFKHARTRVDFLEILSRWADVLHEVAHAPRGLEALARVIRYILLVNSHVELTSLQALVDRVAGPEAKDIIMTAGERLIEEGIQRGERAFLLRMLRSRFGDQVNAAIEQRVAAASSEQIARWAERLWSATSLSELLAG